MRTIIPFLCFVVALLIGCSASHIPDSASLSPQNPPTPRLPSILPLAAGNHWSYSYSEYDSMGTKVRSRNDLDLRMPLAYGVTHDDSLVPIFTSTYYSTGWDYDTSDFREYVYQYEWEDTDSGVLVTYRDLHVTPGVYIVGEFVGNDASLRDTPVLWLAYPATEGHSTVLSRDTATGDSVTIAVMGTSQAFYHKSDGPLPIRYYDCYLYRETTGESEIYYYYHPSFGALGYLRYNSGKLRTSYILESFSSR